MNDDRELEVDLAYAVRSLRAVEGVYALDVPLAARRHPDALSFAVVLLPYDLERLGRAPRTVRL